MRSSRTIPAAFTSIAVLVLLIAPALPAQAGEGYLRHPDIHGDLVVFNAEEDLWTAPAEGGTALRLTSHVGTEYFPRFSPDGATVAFTGEYDGNLDIYVVPVAGGEPRRLTWNPTRDEVIGWMPDGSEVLFRSRREHPHFSWEMFAVPVQGGDPRKLPIGRSARLAIDPASGQWAINRLSREMSTWKRYRGGTNPDIWVGHPDRNDFRRVTQFSGWDAFPMWRDGSILFLSDQGGTANLWSMNPDGSNRQRLTTHENWDMRWPEMGPGGRIVYMFAGGLRLFDPATGDDRAIDITLTSESVLTRRRYPSSTRRLEHVDLSPDGERVVIVTRGEVFSVPVEKGVTLAVSSGSSAREKWASFDGKGEKIIYVTDAPGEEEIREIDAWGRGEPRTIKAAGENGWHFPPVASPDGEWIAWADQTQTLWVMKRAGGNPIRVDRSPQEEIREYVWSPDSRWLAYSRSGHTDFPSIYIYDTKENGTRAVTSATTIDGSPAWDPDGRWLAFLSDRTINPMFGQRDFQNIEFRPTKPYLLLLKKDAKSPFRKDSGLPPAEGKDKKKKEKKDKKDKDDEDDEEKQPEPIEIDWDGLEDRIVEVPMDAGRYGALGADAGHLYMLSYPVSGMREPPSKGPRGSLVMYDLEEEEDEKVAGGVSAYEVEPGAEKILFQKKRGDLYVIDAGSAAPDDLSEHSVSLDDVVIELHPREEWAQIYWEGWRHMRDFYWDENMAGVDWKAVGDQYATLLPRLAVRDDLRDLMGELIGELSTSHTYVWGGDRGASPKRVPVGMLGLDVAREGDAYRIVTIYRGDPADETRAPLDAPDLDVQEGEYIVSVNRKPFPADRPFAAAFENTSGKQVVLAIAASSEGKESRDVVVTPTGSERRQFFARSRRVRSDTKYPALRR